MAGFIRLLTVVPDQGSVYARKQARALRWKDGLGIGLGEGKTPSPICSARFLFNVRSLGSPQ
ncbi:MAG: hypothetical protein A3E79_07655 [Burkholderiales bacterium RIFCSPHIGHO2_12_FULL_61_11]|nr:MAG: hypothetical protein A3E79_07655 [Burkholderiales bacterium RIFCSPHIGHO2_12_FULL_61_11]